MDIAAWLRGLGLGQYEPAFRANEIDERVLPSLTSEDLREIGVVPIGHRRRLLDAIAALRTEAPAVAETRRDARQRSFPPWDVPESSPQSCRLSPIGRR